jgi:penicillin amidase
MSRMPPRFPGLVVLLVFGVAVPAGGGRTWQGTSHGARSTPAKELARQALAPIDGERHAAGLQRDVRVVRDRWGVPHIYAESVDDLFFAQGYVTSQDRLWQMEMWRRASEGRLAEILGPAAADRDHVARLLKYRGPFDDSEWTSYHPDSRRIMTAFVNGINAYIRDHANRLPVEFVVTGITPEPWTIETLVLRQTSFGDATNELQLARSIAQFGAAEANRRRNPDPWEELVVPEGLDASIVGEDVLAAARTGSRTARPDVLPVHRPLFTDPAAGAPDDSLPEPGSNNWVVSGALSTTGRPVVANDPHREVGLPSLRYIVHLSAPGWNAIGASEPPFLGVAIGHNDRLAWGLTIVGTDQHDVFVEDVNPANPREVLWNGTWEPLRVIREEILVKGAAPRTVDLEFSRHGPIFYRDVARRKAYAVRSALHEPGTAPYLAGLRLSQARDCREFLAAAMYWKAPSENLICGDVAGNISWQASALTPARQGWSGRLPVPGTGRYEWQGFRKDLPRELNPARGFIATANHNIQPAGYSPPLMFKNRNTQFDRITRLLQLIRSDTKYSLEDHQRMQQDAYSLRAAAELPLFRGWTAGDADVERARAIVAAWDAVYERESAAAALYESWRSAVDAAARDEALPLGARRAAVEAGLRRAIERLTRDQGRVWSQWRWGRMHRHSFRHPFLAAFDLPAVERPGGAGTIAADGASYREILDVSNWDRSLVTHTPGQSAQPESPYYGNLLPLWAVNTYFPLVYSRAAVDANAAHRLTLKAQ